MIALQFEQKERPAYAIAFLQRAGLGEIYVRRAGHFVERRYFDLKRCACGEHLDHGELAGPSCEAQPMPSRQCGCGELMDHFALMCASCEVRR